MMRLTKQERRKYWRGIIKEFEKSGLSKAEFCRRKGITSSAFYSWSKMIAVESQELGTDSEFIPLTQNRTNTQSSADISLTLKLPTGAELNATGPFNVEMLRDLIQGLL